MPEKDRGLQTLKYMYQILCGLKQLHLLGLAHKDLKPENILIDQGNAKLADFCLSQKLADIAYLKTSGTKIYAPPETLILKIMTIESDVWALGIIIIEILTGKHIFQGETLEETIQNIKEGRFQPIPSNIEGELRKTLERMINEDPIIRPTVKDILGIELMKLQYRNEHPELQIQNNNVQILTNLLIKR
ncbi:MAG: putative 5'-AMP-activated protein kinase catalytic subunit alpha-2 [Streblomastix strix]|uniref:Putative 5'-AMP-activated protein kinase catalytic subunit alpha-2 n=1 Tax=Streblomastix strix TaxID=222440 RepID=A0A5J4X5P9_9EUKA|nr:MAG: putative 5'-AMP-activated protein kinase catalytic subunit alpha-2 [Streblomastix strix]